MADSKTLLQARNLVLEKCAADPAYFIFRHCKTKDEHAHTAEERIKQFPDYDYLRYTLDFWHNGPKLTYSAKSRQLMFSWLMSAYGLWTAKFMPFSWVLFQSKREEDAAAMIYKDSVEGGRMSLMEANLPEYMQVCKTVAGTYLPTDIRGNNTCSSGKITFPNGSKIEALAMGADKIESKVPSLFLNDEASLQSEWASAQAAAQPCLDGAARGVTIGTMRLPSDYGEEISTSWDTKDQEVMRGVSHFISPEGVPGIRVHYTADPHKRPETREGEAWKNRQLTSGAYKDGEKGYRWQQHMEINPRSRSGTLCIPILQNELYSESIVITDKSMDQMRYWSFDSGMDWGVVNNTVWMVLAMDPEGNRYVTHMLAEPAENLGGVEGVSRRMREHPLFERLNGSISADPAMWKRDQSVTGGVTNIAELFKKEGVYLRPAKARGQEADQVALDRLNHYYWPDDRAPALFIFASVAKKLLARWQSLVYQQWSEGVAADKNPQEKMKDLRVDEFDAFKYAEVAWPDYPRYSAPPKTGTYAWYKGRYKDMNKVGGDLFATSR